MQDTDFNKAFYEIYELYIDEYEDISVKALPFTTSTINHLLSHKIISVTDLLRLTPYEFMQIKTFGRKKLDEVDAFCAMLNIEGTIWANINKKESINKKELSNIPSLFFNHRLEIASGDFSAFNKMTLSERDEMFLQKYKEAFSILGKNLSFKCVVSPQSIIPVVKMFTDYYNQVKRNNDILKIVNSLPLHRKANRALGYINAFTLDEDERLLLKDLCESEETTLISMAKTDKVAEYSTYALLIRFYEWCAFDLEKEIRDMFNVIYSYKRTSTVIRLRSKKNTLNQVGKRVGLTRERVRQIEKRAKKHFSRLCSKIRIIPKISAERNGNTILTPDDIVKYCGEQSSDLLFFLQSYKCADYAYDKELDVFIVGDTSVSERVRVGVEGLPDIIKSSHVNKLLSETAEEADVPMEMLEKTFLVDYQLTGKVYHRCRLSLATICKKVVDTHYPQGIKVYDADEIRRFREIVADEYGDVRLPSNDRALSTRITSVCVLCGKGLYRMKNKNYLPRQLANEICKYMENSQNTIFLTNTLFSIFEKELLSAGIDNKYFLQGVLHDMFPDKFVFRRDYISKDVEITSLYSSVVNFIKQSNFPVSKAEIQNVFPGITDIVITLSVNDSNVINYFGEYLHASKLNLSDYEKSYLFTVIYELTNDGEAHHIREVHEIVVCQKPEILTRNAAMHPFSTFSVAEYLFRDKFHFSRPYIAKHGVEIGRPAERLHDLIYSDDEFNISEISEFSKENHFQINSLLEYVNECNDEFLLINDEMMMRIDRIGIDEAIAYQVENIIAESIYETTPIKDLTILARLPHIHVPWTDWLIYSVIFKWGTKVVVGTSSNQFRLAIPLVAPINNFNSSLFKDVEKSNASTSYIADDLSNIDLLLEDFIEDETLDIF